MGSLSLLVILGCTTLASAVFNGPYLFWGSKAVRELQHHALEPASEGQLSDLYDSARVIMFFVRNDTQPLDGSKYPKLETFVKKHGWAYLPEEELAADPFNQHINTQLIELRAGEENEGLLSQFSEAEEKYGRGRVLGILANPEQYSHRLMKRQSKKEDNVESTTMQTPVVEEPSRSFLFFANGSAMLHVTSAILLNLTTSEETIKLMEHIPEVTAQGGRANGYTRLCVTFLLKKKSENENEKEKDETRDKLPVRFNFTLISGNWAMTGVEVNDTYNLRIVGNIYETPSAPLGFSYHCSSRPMLFTDGNNTLIINDYQVQAFINTTKTFGEAYDCIGFVTAPIISGIFVSFLLLGVISLGVMAIMDIKTPNRFESSRSKQLTFSVQE